MQAFLRWLAIITLSLLLQLCCCDLRQCCGWIGERFGRAHEQAACCRTAAAGRDGASERSAPADSCKCGCESRHGYASDSRAPHANAPAVELAAFAYAATALPVRVQDPPLCGEIRCRGGPRVALCLLHCALLV